MSQQQYYGSYPDPYRRSSSSQQPQYTYPSSIPIRPAPTSGPGYGYNYPSTPSSPYSPTSSYSTSPTSPMSSYPQYPPTNGPGEYVCLWQGCIYSCTRNADLQRHYQNVHNRESAPLVDCAVQGCGRKGAYGFTRKDKMVEHLREVHKVDIPKRGNGRREGGYKVCR